MAALSRKIRSISLPPRSHPATARIEEEITKFKSWESAGYFSSSGSVLIGLAGLEKLYLSLDDLLNLATTPQALSRGDRRHVNGLLDSSVVALDVCGITKDLVSHIKEQTRELESTIRRRKGDAIAETCAVDFDNMRKKTKRDARRLMGMLRQMDGEAENVTSPPVLLEGDQHLFCAVMRVLREVHTSSISVVRSVLTFLSGPTTGQAKWSLLSRLMLKGASAETELKSGNIVNEFEHVSAAQRALCSKGDAADKEAAARVLQKRMVELEVGIGGIEEALESMFRRMVKARATLLNIVYS